MIDTEIKYKTPIISWLPEKPKHWKVTRIKNLFREMDNRSVTGDEELLSVSQYTGITPKRDSLENEDDFISNAETLENYKKVAVGDLVINIMLAWNGSLGISPYNGITSPAYCVYRCLPGNNPEYFGYLFSTALFKGEFRRNSTGIIDSRLRLYTDKFFSIFSLVPPKEEQDRIVEHIKTQSEKINRFIAAKKRFIELLKEQRQGVINNAVTKGITPEVKMKSTGIEWLGEVPNHWLITKLKNTCKIIRDGTHLPPPRVDFGKPLLSVRNLKDGGFISFLDDDSQVSEENFYELIKQVKPQKDDILLAIVGATMGKVSIVPEMEPFAIQRSLCLLRVNEICCFEYLFFSIQAKYFNDYIWFNTAYSAQPGIYLNSLMNFKIFIPPSIEEQEKIVEYIKAETTIINTAISKAEREIELIKEYKDAMIAEAVMGKRKVI